MRFKLTIEYDGAGYVGWQAQDNGPSVQAAVERAVEAFNGQSATVYGAGRTDAGVHALGQVAHVDISKEMDAFKVMNATNAHLRGEAIAVVGAEEVGDDFHARFSATGRAYRYEIINRRAPLTLERGRAWQVAVKLDAGAMHDAAQSLVGLHDFTTFRAVQCQAKSAEKTLDRLDVMRHGERIIVEAGARSFLHHQVRSMVGCLKLVGEGKWRRRDMERALQARDRAALGFNAPPDGLYLVRVDYEAGGSAAEQA